MSGSSKQLVSHDRNMPTCPNCTSVHHTHSVQTVYEAEACSPSATSWGRYSYSFTANVAADACKAYRPIVYTAPTGAHASAAAASPTAPQDPMNVSNPDLAIVPVAEPAPPLIGPPTYAQTLQQGDQQSSTDMWSCIHCTFLNSPHSKSCTMCCNNR